MNIQESLQYWSNKAYGKENESPLKISAILMYECADLSREINRLKTYPDEEVLRRANIKTAVGDVLAMTQLICAMLDLDFSEMYMTGCQRAVERCKEKLSGK
ncbi:hypothetical protein LCGC14_2527750, partial [marine sediment metagenome]